MEFNSYVLKINVILELKEVCPSVENHDYIQLEKYFEKRIKEGLIIYFSIFSPISIR